MRQYVGSGAFPLLERVRLLASVEESPERLEVLRVLGNYLEFHSGRMDYRERLSLGLAIGSGQVEGVCQHLIGARLKQTGASQPNGVICSLYYGDQWNDYWKTAQ